jgi:hypothetical protein
MPDVGLKSSAERLKEEYKVVIKYTIEIEGLPVYAENYDAAKLRKEVEADEQTLREYWFRRVKRYCPGVARISSLKHFKPLDGSAGIRPIHSQQTF